MTSMTMIEIAEAVLRGDMHVDELLSLPNATNVQDTIITVGQGTVAPRADDYLGREDVGILLLRNIWKRELQAFAEGRPLKQWHRPPLIKVSEEVTQLGSAPADPALAWRRPA
jgi:hypothetical protein